jgi:hypothetical protein
MGTFVTGSTGGSFSRCNLISEENPTGSLLIHSTLLSTRMMNSRQSTGFNIRQRVVTDQTKIPNLLWYADVRKRRQGFGIANKRGSLFCAHGPHKVTKKSNWNMCRAWQLATTLSTATHKNEQEINSHVHAIRSSDHVLSLHQELAYDRILNTITYAMPP